MKRVRVSRGFCSTALLGLLLFVMTAESAQATGGHFRRLFGRFSGVSETVLVEPTTYVLSESRCCGDEVVVTGYAPTRYYVVSERPTRYIATTLSSFDLPTYSSSMICCDSAPSTTASYSSACCESDSTPAYKANPNDKPAASSGSTAPPAKSIESRVRKSNDDPIPPPHDSGDGAGATADKAASPDGNAAPNPASNSKDPAKKNDRGLSDLLPPLPETGSNGSASDASKKSAEAGGAATNPPAPSSPKSDPSATKTANSDPSSPIPLPNELAEQPAGVIRREARKPTPPPTHAILEGKVIDIKTREPLPESQIILTNTQTKTTTVTGLTDALGRYAVKIPNGQWQLTIAGGGAVKPFYYGDFIVEDGFVKDVSGRRYSSVTLKR